MAAVSFQGERGAYGEAAALAFFGSGTEAIACQTFADALEAASSGRAAAAVLPVENSIEGSVGESCDLLYSTGLRVTGEVYQRIEHCLIGAGGLDGIRTVYSHPQALGQCRRFIQSRGMRTVPTYDTAGSVGIVKGIGRDDTACIASAQAAQIHGLPVISSDIADSGDNVTRFLVLSRPGPEPPGSDKTSVIFSVRHERGALCRIMEMFDRGGINLTKIESRPAGSWEYNFYVDFEGSESDPAVAGVVETVKKEALSFKSLGSYPSAKTPGAGGR